jgi:hypothetical protein
MRPREVRRDADLLPKKLVLEQKYRKRVPLAKLYGMMRTRMVEYKIPNRHLFSAIDHHIKTIEPKWKKGRLEKFESCIG